MCSMNILMGVLSGHISLNMDFAEPSIEMSETISVLGTFVQILNNLLLYADASRDRGMSFDFFNFEAMGNRQLK